MVGLPELSWEDQQQIQEQVQLKLRQEQHVDQHQQIRDSSRAPSRDSKRRIYKVIRNRYTISTLHE